MTWDFSTDQEFEERLRWVDRFVREELWLLEAVCAEMAPRDLDAALESLQSEVKRQGLWAAHLPPELGGGGFGQVKLALMHEILGRSHLGPRVFGNQAPDSGNAEILATAGTEAQKQRYLQPLLAGAISSAFSMTEPETAGSDPTLLGARAVPAPDGGWVLDGRKWFTTNGSRADFLIVMAVTDPEAEGHRRASMFLVDAASSGVTVLRDVATMEHPFESFGGFGNHAEISYEGVRLSEDALLGARGDGFRIAQQRLGPGRIHHCMRWLGASRRAFEMLCERALSRTAHGGALADKQTVQNWIADSATEMHALRMMTLHAAWLMDRGGATSARREIAMIKSYGSRVLHDVIDRALQIHGALGYSTDLPLERMYREARAARIYDGPDEVHRQSLARQTLKEFSPSAGAVPSEHLPSRRVLARQRYSNLLEG